MTTPATKDLYKQLRTATLTKDEAAAVRILQRILAIDPGDESAARQLAALSGRLKKNPAKEKKKKETTATKSLYQRYRTASLAHNDEEAFSLLEEILRLDPDDTEAEKQKRAVGRRLANSLAPELSEAVASGEIAGISSLLEKLEHYAEKDFLETLPDYAAANALYQAEQTRVAKEKLNELLKEFALAEEPFARHEKASSIQDFAEKNGLELSPKIQTCITEAHDNWEQLCRESDQYEEFNALADEYNQLKQKVSLREELQNRRVELEMLRNRVRQLDGVTEVDYLVEQMDKTMAKIIRGQQEQKKKKLLLRCLLWGCLALLAAVGGVVTYAYKTVDERRNALFRALAQKNAQAVRALVENAYPMAYIYRRVDPSYTEQLNRAYRWLRGYNDISHKVRQYEKWLDENMGKSDIAQSEALLEGISRGESLLEEMNGKYGVTPSADLARKHEQFCNEVVIELKQKALSKYNNPPADSGLETLANLYSEYKGVRHRMEFSEEENAAIRQAFRQRAENILFHQIDDENALNKAIEQCKKYTAPLELPDEMLRRLTELRRGLTEFLTIDQQLKQCSTLDEYIRVLRKSEKYLNGIPGCCKPDVLAAYANALPNVVLRMRADALSRRYARMSDSELKEPLEKIRDVYSGKASLFSDFDKAEYSRIVDLLTLPEKSPFWSNKFRQITNDGKIYIGTVFQVNNIPHLRKVKDDGTISDNCIRISGSYKNKSLELQTLRVNVGINRLDLHRGVVHPTQLMLNLAKANSDKYSALARAYLFSLCIDLLNCVEEERSGVLLSVQLKKDIKRFKELSVWLSRNGAPLSENCWIKTHSVESEARIRQFFDSIADRDYAAEIVDAVGRLKNGGTILVGYVSRDGKYVSLRANTSGKRYLYSLGKLAEYTEGIGTPFAPVFTIDYK